MREIKFWRLNAFTSEPFTGNPAAVVPDADGLSDELMQRIAPELNSVSETVFIVSPDDPAADLRLRYFTSTTEVDLCGHATISALFVLAECGRIKGTDGTQKIRAQTRVGILDLGLSFEQGRMVGARMTQLAPRVDRPTEPLAAPDVLGLGPERIRSDLEVGCCNTGIWACYVPLVDLDALRAVRVRNELIGTLWPENADLAGVYPYVITDTSGAPGELAIQGRFFSPPQYGIVEDPVTGTACGALGGWLMEQGLLDRSGTLHATQGVEMGRPGKVSARRTSRGAMEVSGTAVTVLRGEIHLP